MNEMFQNLNDEKAVSSKMHQEIMKAVKVAKRKYYLIGLFCGFLFSALIFGYLFYTELLADQGWTFLSEFIDSIKIDFSLITDFYSELAEFIPWYQFAFAVTAIILFIFIFIIILKYRRVLFSKVEKFNKN
ncbi:MAG: hypothetical protein WCT11_03170 [Candidatus Magasanikbacteria bacterium]